MSALSELINAANRSDLSARAISRAAQSRGRSLTQETANNIIKGKHGRPRETTLVAFSEVLGISLKRLHEAVGVQSDNHEPFILPPEAARLTARQKSAVEEIVRAMLEPGAPPEGQAEIESPPGSPSRVVEGKDAAKTSDRRSQAG